MNAQTNEFYVSYIPMSEVPIESLSDGTFANLQLAQKNSQKKHGFRKRLLDTCQNEFENAVRTVSALLFFSSFQLVFFRAFGSESTQCRSLPSTID
jgi:hypothetical protein